MDELKFAVECGLSVEFKELSSGNIQASWNDGNSVYITDKQELTQAGLI